MLTLTHSPFLKALGWTLLNSLWQFGILWLIFLTFLHIGKKYSPALKHGVAVILISAGFAWFAAGLSYQYFTYSESLDTVSPIYHFPGNTFYPYIYRSIKTFLENNLSYLSIFYLVIVTGFFTRFFRFFFHSYTIQTQGLDKLKPELRLYVQKLVQQLDIKRQVRVWISEYIDTPMVMGFVKPVILIPVACINQLSTKQLEAILLHELAHIRRNDYLLNLFIAIVEMLFFFNPFARLLVRSVKQEREKSCDDWVMQFRFDPHQYASALLSLEQSRSATYSLAIAAAGENNNLLLQRVKRIMGINKANPESGFKLLAYFLTIGLLSFIAFTNPGNLVVENFEQSYKEAKFLVPRFTSALQRTTASRAVATVPGKPEKPRLLKPKSEIPANVTDTDIERITNEEDLLALPASINIDNVDVAEETPQAALLQSIVIENKNFSIREKSPELPAAAQEAEYPFVPNSSYSFYITEDSSVIRLKAEKNKEQTVNQSLAQTRKAIDKLDWNKIAKNQKLSKATILKLQTELKQSLNKLNWSKIYNEAMDSINKESTEKMRSSLKTEYEKLNNYRSMQLQYETIKTELQQQQDKYKKGVEKELQEIDKEVKKRKVIVYI